jgi:Protein of unknown function (DUF3761)
LLLCFSVALPILPQNTQGSGQHQSRNSSDKAKKNKRKSGGSTQTGTSSAPNGPTAKCKNGTCSFSKHYQGTCSHHAVLRSGTSKRFMATESTQRVEQPMSVEEKIGGLEKTLALDARLQALEAAIKERLPATRPWWKDAKVVTLLGALIAAILPVATWISNVYASSREANRLLIEQQETIRQKYLERAFRPGITQMEQEEVFGLLARLSSDRELQAWAKDQLQRTKDTTNDLKKALEQAEKTRAASQATVASLNAKVSQLTASEREIKADAAGAVTNLNKRIERLTRQIGNTPVEMEPNTCDVQFDSDPQGASVGIPTDDKGIGMKLFGQTPFHKVLPIGVYGLRFQKAGFMSALVQADLDPENCKVFAQLDPGR